MHSQEKPAEVNRTAIAGMLMSLFEHWGLTTAEQLSFLGLSENNRAALSKYRKGAPLVNDRDKLERAGTLLGIHKSLRLLFPRNREIAYRWIKMPNKSFEGMTPVQVIEQYGVMGLYMVRAYLDRQRGS
jgi:hypothetical protein